MNSTIYIVILCLIVTTTHADRSHHPLSTNESDINLHSAVAEYKTSVQVLCGLIREKSLLATNNQAHKLAMRAVENLGLLRATEAVPAILNVIEVAPELLGPPNLPEDYVTVRSLVQIGLPSVDAVIAEASKISGPLEQVSTHTTTGLTTSKPEITIRIPASAIDRLRLKLYAAVVHGVYGDELGAIYVDYKATKNPRLFNFRTVYFEQYPRR